MLVLCLALLSGQFIQAENTESAEREIEEIIITARRTSQKYSELPDNITVITAQELSQMPVNSLADALNLVTGVDMQSRGPFGHQSAVTIQGCEPLHVRVMVDGVLLDCQGRALPDLSQIPLENIERIEIIKGTGSSAWGSSLGGVINIITKSPSDQPGTQGNFTFSGGWGDAGFWRRILELSGQTGKFGYYIWENNLNTDDEFRPNSEILSQKASAKFSYLLSDRASLEASFHYNWSDMGGFEFTTYGEDYLYNTRYGSLKLSLLPQDGFDFNATAKFSKQDTRLKQFALPSKTTINKVATENVFAGLDLQSTLFLAESQTLLLGIDLGRDQLDSDLMDHKEYLRRQGYYANYNLLLGERYSINLGGRYDNNAAYGEQFSPSAGLVYHLPYAQTDLRVSVARAFNAPPLLYKYISSSYYVPNDDLKAERAPVVYEFSAETRPLSDLWFKFALYRAEVKDLVKVVVVPPGKYQAQNINKVRRQGIESELRYHLMENLQAQGGCSFNRVQDRETGQIVQGGGVARLTYNLGLNYNYEKKLNLNLKGNYRFWNELDSSNAKDRKFIWDMRINYDIGTVGSSTKNKPRLSTFMNIYNILDTEYYYDELLPLPGRQIELGLKYSF